jgi:predicted permease
MTHFWQDIRYGIRILLQRPAFTAMTVLILALGISINSAIFSVVDGVLLRSLPYAAPDRLVMLWESGTGLKQTYVSNKNFIDWREQSKSFENVSAYSARFGGQSTILGGSEPVRAYVVSVYRDFFQTLGVQPKLGRIFTADDSRAGSPMAAIVSYGFWQRYLGSESNLTDKKLTVGDESYSVIGVMPESFSFPAETDIWVSKEQFGPDPTARSAHNYIGIGRLKDGVTEAQAQAEMSTIAARISEQDPDDRKHNNVSVVSMKDQLTGPIRPILIALVVAVIFVLLIACANVANLQLARAVGRRREIAVRVALGAGRARIIRQLLTENLLLAVGGGLLGILLAQWLVYVLVSLGPASIPRLNEIRIDARVLGFTLAISLFSSLVFGLVPALQASKPDMNEALKEGGRSTRTGSTLFRNGLVIAEISLTVTLVIAAGLMVKSLWKVLEVKPGFNAEHALTAEVSLPATEYGEAEKRIQFYRQLLSDSKNLNGVRAAGIINNLPLGGVDINGAFGINGRPLDQGGYASYRITSPDYFRALDIPLISGRFFTDQDNENSEPVALISKSVADKFFAGVNPIGIKVISVNDVTSMEEVSKPSSWTTIVGIVGDVKHAGLEGGDSVDLYVNYAQRPRRISDMTIVVRSDGDPSQISQLVRNEIRGLDPDLPVRFQTMNEIVSRSVSSRKYTAELLSVFTVLALALSVFGIYSVISYTVSNSTREIGIRIALGAQRLHISKLVLGQGVFLAVISTAIGIALSYVLTKFMESMMFGVRPHDAAIYVAAGTVVFIFAILASWVPTRRALRTDPMVALRYE